MAVKILNGAPEARSILEGESDVEGEWFFLGNAWAALHFTLSGEYPITKDRCAKDVDLDEFRSWYSVKDLDAEAIPPRGWIGDPQREDFLVDSYDELRVFYRDAVNDRECILIEFVPSED